MTTVYVLECANSKYYVGKTTKNIQIRYQEHCNGSSTWTRIHPPIRILENLQDDTGGSLEDSKTIEYMNRYGVDNVRGGSYIQENLSAGQKESIRRSIANMNDLCFKCNKPGHFANQCDIDSTGSTGSNSSNNSNPDHSSDERDDYYCYESCYKCGEPGHYAEECYNNFKCFNCGKLGHFAKECYNNFRCFNCGEPGHFADECHEVCHDNSYEYYNYDEGYDNYNCYNCGRSGHFARECRYYRYY